MSSGTTRTASARAGDHDTGPGRTALSFTAQLRAERPAAEGRSGRSLRSVDRVTCRVIAGLLTFYAVVTFSWALSPDLSGAAATVMAALGLGTCVVVWRAWQARLRPADTATMATFLLVALGVEQTTSSTGIGIQGGPAYSFGVATMIMLALQLPPRRFVPLTLGVAGVYVVGRALAAGSTGLSVGLDETVSDLATIASAGLVLEFLRQAARRADLAHDRSTDGAARKTAARTERAIRRERRRVLHDEVIAALMTIDHAAGPQTQQLAASAARRALDRVGDGAAEPPPEDPGGFLVDVDDLGLDVAIEVEAAALALDVPAHVRVAFNGAMREALRNVRRHAGTPSARLVVSAPGGESLRAVVSDDGRGLDPEHEPGFGIRQSIIARLREVGGLAEVTSEPGRGTTVTLTWSASRPRTGVPLAELRSTVGDPKRFVRAVTAVSLSGQLWLVARHLPPSPEVAEVLVTVATIGLVLGVAALAGSRPLGPRLLAAVVALDCLAVWAGLATAEPGAILDFDGFSIQLTCVLAFTLSFVVPVRWLVGLGVALSLTVLAWTLRSGVPLDECSDPILQPVFYAVAMAAVTHGFRTVSRRADEDESAAVIAAAHRAADLTQARADADGVQRLLDSIASFLTDIDEGRLDASSPISKDRARVLALQARDELYLPGLLDDEARALLAEARGAGTEIDIRASGAVPTSEAPLAVLRAALASPGLRRVTLTLPRRASDATRLITVPALSPAAEVAAAAALADHGAVLASDDLSTSVTVPPEEPQSGR